MRKIFVFFLQFSVFGITLTAGASNPDSTWVDSVFKSLSFEQRIAQLMIIRAWSNHDTIYDDSLTSVITTCNVGGVCFFKGTPHRQAALINRWQQVTRTPLLVSIDAEWGMGMRIDSAFSFPRALTLGASPDDSLNYTMGTLVADACKRLGIQINFAPVVDINNNPKNPVIHFRSFGEDRERVTRKSALYMKGMQDRGIMATAKHFPGHGDTDTDSHLTLPVINHSRNRMDSIELYPFKALISDSVKGIMIAHLYVPCFDSTKDLPTTLSRNVITGLLKQQLGFKGFVITDALDMQGVTNYFKPGEIEIKALLAGNDILLLPQHVELAIRSIKTAVDSGRIDSTLINEKCRKILRLKKEMGLNHSRSIGCDHLTADLNPPEAFALEQKIFKSSITLIANPLNRIPVTGIGQRTMACLSIGDSNTTVFQQTLSEYARVDHFNCENAPVGTASDSLIKVLSRYDLLIIGCHKIHNYPADSFGLTRSTLLLIDTLTKTNRSVLAFFGSPYALGFIAHPEQAEALVLTYQDSPVAEKCAAELIFGGIPARGTLPVMTSGYRSGTGETTEKTRLETVLPLETGLPDSAFRPIDSLAISGITAGAYPGCQVLFAKDGKIVYRKSFGSPRYNDSTKVVNNDLYDLASITKIAATTLAVMKLYEEGKINPDDSLGNLLPGLKWSNKADLKISEVMTHQAGLQTWIKFYEKTLASGQPDPEIYRQDSSAGFPCRVADHMYIREDYRDTLFHAIIDSPLRNSRDYKYSDLGFYLLLLVVERLSGQSFDQYLETQFYRPMGLQTMGFNPLKRFRRSQIIPTEMDTIFRQQLVWGDVHDPGAAMLGGISGHAGLFSDSHDLAVVMQMLLNGGWYGGHQYLKPSTIAEFTRVRFPGTGNRRGLGFDKPLLNDDSDGPACKSASPSSFGHSGFTGTYAWADPSNNLVYIFLSNRIYPSASNQKLSEMNIRTRIHQSMYDILNKYKIK